MDYLVDTVALVRHLRGKGKIGNRARQILREADAGQHIIAISAVTLMEILYLKESRRIPIDLNDVRWLLTQSINYRIVPIDFDVVATTASVDDVPELHDRLIVATAKWLNIPILTSDSVIQASRHVQTFRKNRFSVTDLEKPSVSELGMQELPAHLVKYMLRIPWSIVFQLRKGDSLKIE